MLNPFGTTPVQSGNPGFLNQPLEQAFLNRLLQQGAGGLLSHAPANPQQGQQQINLQDILKFLPGLGTAESLQQGQQAQDPLGKTLGYGGAALDLIPGGAMAKGLGGALPLLMGILKNQPPAGLQNALVNSAAKNAQPAQLDQFTGFVGNPAGSPQMETLAKQRTPLSLLSDEVNKIHELAGSPQRRLDDIKRSNDPRIRNDQLMKELQIEVDKFKALGQKGRRSTDK